MKELFKNKCINEVVKREAGYVNHPADKGGPTNFGITQAVAREYGFFGDMRDLPEATAIKIYDEEYWQHIRLDDVQNFSLDLANFLFDFAVNSGVVNATEQLQRLLNSLNHCEDFYPDIDVDGGLGQQTLSALDMLVSRRGLDGLKVLEKSINALRIAYLVDVTESKESQEQFTFGWLLRVVSL